MLKGMITNNHDIEYWKKEYLKMSKDNDKLEQEIQQYKQQIDELKKEIDRIWNLEDVNFYYERLNRMTFKLKERNEE